MTFGADIHGHQRMNPTDFGHFLTFHQTLPFLVRKETSQEILDGAPFILGIKTLVYSHNGNVGRYTLYIGQVNITIVGI